MDFESCFKVYNSVSVYPKNIKLGQRTTVNIIFHVVVLSIGSNFKLVPVPCAILEQQNESCKTVYHCLDVLCRFLPRILSIRAMRLVATSSRTSARS